MGQTSKAQSTYEKALELDPQCSEALEGYRNCSIATHSDPEEVRYWHNMHTDNIGPSLQNFLAKHITFIALRSRFVAALGS